MKKFFFLGLLAVCLGGTASAQAPTSLGGLTLRINYNAGVQLYVGIFDFLPNGTFNTRLYLNTQAGPLPFKYLPPSSGTYTVRQISSSQLAISMSADSFQVLTLNFIDATHGYYADQLGEMPFSLLPTASTPATRALVNLSTLVTAKQGSPIVLGFVVGGTGPREVLIRALGPGLAQFGVSNFAPNPVYRFAFGPLMPGEVYPAGNSSGFGWSSTPAA